MLKFNNNHIFTGYIKQILHNFNLPMCRVYTREQQEYFNTFGEEKDILCTIARTKRQAITTDKSYVETFPINMYYNLYIKDNMLQYYLKEENTYTWKVFDPTYTYASYKKNITKNLKITNNIYDYYTHEYLGEYLRFNRDYLGLDLMSLYNCFSNRICNALLYSFELKDAGDSGNKNIITFDSSDQNYKIYMLPVKLFKKYTIAIDSNLPVEICCGLYSKYSYINKSVHLPEITYKRYGSMSFGSPILYDSLQDLYDYINQESGSELAQHEIDLKMFIKLPATNNSSIVVLEGDYRSYNDSLLTEKFTRKQNHTITNFNINDFYYVGTTNKNQIKKYQDFSEFTPISALQLLRANTKVSYPFADRLIEYLTENVITSEETNIDNIKRIQKVILSNINNKQKVIIEENNTSTSQVITTEHEGYLIKNLTPKLYGVWDNTIRPIVYEQFNNNVRVNRNDTNHDILGYIDKEIEINYTTTTKNGTTSIAGVNLYEKDEQYNSGGY